MAGLSSINMFITVLFSCLIVMVYCGVCPQHDNDPNNVNDRINLLKNEREYSCEDDKKLYRYTVTVCRSVKDAAVLQEDLQTSPHALRTAGTFTGATLTGGTDWLMISYGGGEPYKSHCEKAKRKSQLIITCDPDADRGELKIIEEFRTNTSYNPTQPCYYLFELNHKAACTQTASPSKMSPGSILLIIFLIVVSVYLVLGFLYQRFVAGAKGFEQIPNFNMWRAFGNLQADGCNFICRCAEVRRPPRYKPVEDALSDDTPPPDDDKLLPM